MRLPMLASRFLDNMVAIRWHMNVLELCAIRCQLRPRLLKPPGFAPGWLPPLGGVSLETLFVRPMLFFTKVRDRDCAGVDRLRGSARRILLQIWNGPTTFSLQGHSCPHLFHGGCDALTHHSRGTTLRAAIARCDCFLCWAPTERRTSRCDWPESLLRLQEIHRHVELPLMRIFCRSRRPLLVSYRVFGAEGC